MMNRVLYWLQAHHWAVLWRMLAISLVVAFTGYWRLNADTCEARGGVYIMAMFHFVCVQPLKPGEFAH